MMKWLQEDIDKYTSGDLTQVFVNAAKRLMTEYELVVENHRFQLCELEFYYLDTIRHPDPYVHKDPEQLNCGTFYVHKKGGNYGGIDITFGNGIDIYGGILIRGIKNVQGNTSKDFFSGPNILKKVICKRLAIKNDYKELNKEIEALRVQLVEAEHPFPLTDFLVSTRVGIKPIPADYMFEDHFVYKLYRFITHNVPQHLFKEKISATDYTKIASVKYVIN